MNIFPYKTMEIQSKQTAADVREAIDRACSAGYDEAGVWQSDIVGYRNGNTFVLGKSVSANHRNSFLPQAHGKIIENGLTSTIEIKFQILPFARKLIVFFMLVFGLVFYYVARLSFFSELEDTCLKVKNLISRISVASATH